jgi:hypothetical protein
MLLVGKDVVAQPGDRVMLSKEGSAWCQQRYPVTFVSCPRTREALEPLPGFQLDAFSPLYVRAQVS